MLRTVADLTSSPTIGTVYISLQTYSGPLSRRLLPYCNVLVALLTVVLATGSLLHWFQSPVCGSDVIRVIPSIDNNLRFMGGLGLGLSLALLWMTPAIKRHTTIFHLL